MSTGQLLQQAVWYHSSGSLQQAEALYRKLLESDPRNPDALNLLGTLKRQQGNLGAAMDFAQKALAADPSVADFHFNLAETHRAMGQLEEALSGYDKSLQLNPRDAEAHHARGMVLQALNKMPLAAASLRRAIELDSRLVPAYESLAAVLLCLGQAKEAAAVCQRGAQRQPPNARMQYCLARAFDQLGQLDDAIAACRKAVAFDSKFAEARNLLGILLDKLGLQADAIDAYESAIRVRPDYPEAHGNLANTLKDRLRFDEALAHHRRAMELQPGASRMHSKYLLALNYHPSMSEEAIFQEHVDWGRRYGSGAAAPLHSGTGAMADSERALRVGLLSPDLREHSVAYFIESILARHDLSAIQITCYNDAPHSDAVTRRLKGLADRWRDTALHAEEDLANLIQHDQIDILIDLAGHTAGNRLPMLARRPAPVQITYLGYPNTTGLPASLPMYRLTDALADPSPSADALCTEQLIRLPRCFLCYTPRSDSPPVSPAPFDKAGHVTFASFSQLSKVNLALIELWANVLHATPSSRLRLKAKGLKDPSTCQLLVDAFGRYGISSDRLDLLDMTRTVHEHLTLYDTVDVALDTYPYHGTTTTCEALWMGVPVVTLAGTAHRSRVGVSLLNAASLNESIAATPHEYVEAATALAQDGRRLRELRNALRGNIYTSQLCDSAAFTGHFQVALRTIWRAACASM